MLEIIVTILLGSTKYAITFPLAIYKFQFNFYETIIWLNVAGILGVYFYGYLSKGLISLWKRLFKKKVQIMKDDFKKRKNKKVFTKKNRRIIYIKQRYGLIGIIITTPVLLSIPVGTFLVVRYYRATRANFFYLIAANIGWSLIYTCFYMFWKELFTK